jgi:hypothetical protein
MTSTIALGSQLVPGSSDPLTVQTLLAPLLLRVAPISTDLPMEKEQKVLDDFMKYSAPYYENGNTAFRRLHDVVKEFLFSQGYQSMSVPRTSAKLIVDKISAAHPGQYVIVTNHLGNDPALKVLEHNNISRRYFGNIAGFEAGAPSPRFHSRDLGLALRAVMAAYVYRNQEFRLVWRLKCFNEYRWVESIFHVDPNYPVVVERGRIIDGDIEVSQRSRKFVRLDGR